MPPEVAAVGARRAAQIGLIDIEQAQQLSALAADVADLHERLGAQGLLNLQIEVDVVGRTEVRRHAENAARIGLQASERRRRNNLLAGNNRGGSGRDGEDRA